MAKSFLIATSLTAWDMTGIIFPRIWHGMMPAGTKSFVVTCYDPDAPTGSGWWHWVVVNLPADTRVLPQGYGSGLVALPEGVLQTRTDFGKAGYGGAAPPKGKPPLYLYGSRTGCGAY
jgi:Raf kinase inhibitor-like YbhB/YbcL family protein